MDADGTMDRTALEDFWAGWLSLAVFMFALVNVRLIRVPVRNNRSLTSFRQERWRNRINRIGTHVMLNTVVVLIVAGTSAFGFLNGLKYARFLRTFAHHFWSHIFTLSTIPSNRYRLLLRISLQFAAFAGITYPLTDIAVKEDSFELSRILAHFVRNVLVLSYAAYALVLFTFVAGHFTAATVLSIL